jgi:hypothetical protein
LKQGKVNMPNVYAKSRYFSFIVIILFCGLNCQDQLDLSYSDTQNKDIPEIGARTINFVAQGYERIWYVSVSRGSDEDGDGTKLNPWQSISFALEQIQENPILGRKAILVSGGNYMECNIQMIKHTDLYGGFSDDSWQRDIFAFPAILDGNEKNRLLVAADSCRLDGFLIRGGIVRGKGAGILCDGVSPHITNTIFMGNRTLKPDPWQPKYWHETANDGAAIYCTNGASPIIENSNFIMNETENGRGAAIAADGKCKPVIAQNLFMENITGLDDPMRSSDGGAVSLFDWCDAIVENNLFLGNKALSSNDAGALFIALWSSAMVRNNIFLANKCSDDAGALFVGGQEHRYEAPLDTIPSTNQFFVSIEKNIFIANKNPTKNSGAMRFTMESRGKFSENLVVHNTGIYFQRSETLIEKNTILDNFLLIETKQGLRPSVIRNNLIWANLSILTEAIVEKNNLKTEFPGVDNYSLEPHFVKDFIELQVFFSNFSRWEYCTVLHTNNLPSTTENLKHRIVKAGNNWSVVKDFEVNSVTVWGDFSGETHLTVLPTYLQID